MTTKITNHKKDDAVSPVVGVMLMLVVTIVIAAVVALFATSVVTDTNAAPVAVIQMDAYDGEPSVNQTLNMSIIGGKALELSKLKCVVSVEDGKYGLVFKSLDTDPLVGKYLEIGENLEVFNFGDSGMTKLNSVVGASWAERQTVIDKIQSAWDVGNKVNVMIVFDENAILYKKDIIIQDGTHGQDIVFGGDNATWTTVSSTPMTWDESTVTVADGTGAASGTWTVTIAEKTSANSGSSSSIVMTVAPSSTAGSKVLTGIKVKGSDNEQTLAPTSTASGNFTGALTLTAIVETPTGVDGFMVSKDGDGYGTVNNFTICGKTVTLGDYESAVPVDIGSLEPTTYECTTDVNIDSTYPGGYPVSITVIIMSDGSESVIKTASITGDKTFTFTLTSDDLAIIKEGSANIGDYNICVEFKTGE